MLKTILRLEHPKGFGPFEFGPKMWEESHDNEPIIDQFFLDFAEHIPWVTVHYADEIERLFGYPKRYWQATPDHPHHMEDVTQPDPAESHKWKVGCKDMEQLLHWFPESSHAMLASYGFELVTYECDCEFIHFGTYQLLFCVDHITATVRRPLLGTT